MLIRSSLKNLSVVFVSAFTLSGCAYYASSHTHPQRLGPDTYILNSRGSAEDTTKQRQVAISEGEKFCRGMNREFLTDSIRVVQNAAFREVELVFLCLTPGDPALSRPVLRSRPNSVIEVR